MPRNDTGLAASDPAGPETPYREAMTHLIGERWEAVWAALPAAIDGTDPEGVHDVRVASRRLRAAMDVAVDAFPKPWYRRLHRTAKAITAALGDVRDRDVLLGHLQERRGKAKAADRAGIDLLIARVERERGVVREEMLRFLAGIDPAALATETRRRFPRQVAGTEMAPATGATDEAQGDAGKDGWGADRPGERSPTGDSTGVAGSPGAEESAGSPDSVERGSGSGGSPRPKSPSSRSKKGTKRGRGSGALAGSAAGTDRSDTPAEGQTSEAPATPASGRTARSARTRAAAEQAGQRGKKR
ncbi:MAG: CHAD domain-containing protein [Thermomicrobiales bacterium]